MARTAIQMGDMVRVNKGPVRYQGRFAPVVGIVKRGTRKFAALDFHPRREALLEVSVGNLTIVS